MSRPRQQLRGRIGGSALEATGYINKRAAAAAGLGITPEHVGRLISRSSISCQIITVVDFGVIEFFACNVQSLGEVRGRLIK